MMSSEKKRSNATRVIVKLVITLSFLLLGIWFVLTKKEQFLELEWPSASAISAVSAAIVINIYLSSLFNTLTVRRLGVPLCGSESFMVSTVTTAANFMLPFRSGAGLRAMYMKRVYDFPFSHFASTLAVFYLVTIMAVMCVGMLSLWLICINGGACRFDLLIIFPLVFVIVGFVMLVRKGKEADDSRSHSWLENYLSGYRRILSAKKVVYIAILIVLASFVVSTLGWLVALREYAPLISVEETFLIVASQIIGGLATLTPGGTGFQELAGIYVGSDFPITVVELFAVLVWTKAVRMIVASLLSLPFLVLLKRKMARVENRL